MNFARNFFAALLLLGALAFIVMELGPAGIRVMILVVAVVTAFWLAFFVFYDPTRRIQQLLGKSKFERAFRLALRKGKLAAIDDYLESCLRLPSPCLRREVLDAFSELRALYGSAVDPSNVFIDSSLKTAALDSSNEARRALWNICTNLEVVANQGIEFSGDHPKIEAISERLRALTSSTRQARAKLAELSLGANRGEIEDARIAMETVRRQSESLLELEGVLA